MIPHATKSNVTLIIAAAHPPVPGLEAVSHNRAHFEATSHGCMVYDHIFGFSTQDTG